MKQSRITATDGRQHPFFLFQVFAFLGETLVAMNWAVMADILLVSSPAKTPTRTITEGRCGKKVSPLASVHCDTEQAVHC